MKFTPTLEFVLDAVPESARHIDDLLAQAHDGDARVARAGCGRAATPATRTLQARTRRRRRRRGARLELAAWSSSTSPPAGPPTRWSAGSAGCSAPARSATPARWTRWPPASWWSGSIGPPGCSGSWHSTDKAYAATIRLGVATATDDAEGEVLAARRRGRPGRAKRVGRRGRALTGPIQQVPSAVSAIKVDGVRAYARVRAGEEVALAARAGTGQPLRGARAAGARCRRHSGRRPRRGRGVHHRHVRARAGPRPGRGPGHRWASHRAASEPGPGRSQWPRLSPLTDDPPMLLDLADAVRRCFQWLTVDDPTAAAIRFGRRLTGVTLPAPRAALFTGSGEFLALYRQQLSDAVPEAVFV